MKSILLFVWFVPLLALGQVYPRWFLFQGELPCRPCAVAVANPSTFQRDTAIAYGFRDACRKIARYDGLTVAGGQAFWETEGGTFAMGSNYRESYDSSLFDRVMSVSKVLQSFTDSKKVIVLAGDSSCAVPEQMAVGVPLSSVPKPQWIEEVPSTAGYAYGIGASEEYFYESSSWNAAERNAYMSVARSMRIQLKAMEKQSAIEHQDVRNEELNVRLRHVEIVARWRDRTSRIYYVLARAQQGALP